MSLVKEGHLNEIIAAIQRFRKSLQLEYGQKISLSFIADEPFLAMACQDQEELIETRCELEQFYRPHSLLNCFSNAIILSHTTDRDKINILTHLGEKQFDYAISYGILSTPVLI